MGARLNSCLQPFIRKRTNLFFLAWELKRVASRSHFVVSQARPIQPQRGSLCLILKAIRAGVGWVGGGNIVSMVGSGLRD